MHALSSPSRIGDHKCLGRNAKRPMKEQWPFLIGSCPDKRQVNLACEGAGPSLLSTSQTLTASHWWGGRRGEREKKKGVWIDGDWTWMALSSVLGSMPDYREQVSIFFFFSFLKVVANSHSKVNACCFVRTLHARSTVMKNWAEPLIKNWEYKD